MSIGMLWQGVVQWPIATAVELAKIQIQHRNLQSRENRAYRGSVDAAKQVTCLHFE